MRQSDPQKPVLDKPRKAKAGKGRPFAKLVLLSLVIAIFAVMRTEPEARMAAIYGTANKALVMAGRAPMFDVPEAGQHAARVAAFTEAHHVSSGPVSGLGKPVKVNRFSHATGNAAGIQDMLTGGASGNAASSKGRGDWIGDSKAQAADIGTMMQDFKVGE